MIFTFSSLLLASFLQPLESISRIFEKLFFPGVEGGGSLTPDLLGLRLIIPWIIFSFSYYTDFSSFKHFSSDLILFHILGIFMHKYYFSILNM